jgi:hypothetical protein
MISRINRLFALLPLAIQAWESPLPFSDANAASTNQAAFRNPAGSAIGSENRIGLGSGLVRVGSRDRIPAAPVESFQPGCPPCGRLPVLGGQRTVPRAVRRGHGLESGRVPLPWFAPGIRLGRKGSGSSVAGRRRGPAPLPPIVGWLLGRKYLVRNGVSAHPSLVRGGSAMGLARRLGFGLRLGRGGRGARFRQAPEFRLRPDPARVRT